MTNDFSVLNAADVDRTKLNAFLHDVYRPEKAAFLSQYADWWYRGGNRFVVVEDATARIAGHSATMRGSIVHNGEIVSIQWWVDLVVHPDFRGKGLQTLLDAAIRGTDRLKFAYPARDLSAKMFVKHGWQRHDKSYRYDLKLSLFANERLNRAAGLKGRLARFGAKLTLPMEWGWRQILARYRPQTARRWNLPAAFQLAEVFRRTQAASSTIMTLRDEAYFRWRYFDSPHQWRFYAAGDTASPSLVMIVRFLDVNGIKTARIVDMFGDFSADALQDMLKLIKAECARERIQHLVTIAGLPEVIEALQNTGFHLRDTLIFCWHSEEARYHDWLNGALQHWTYADSDCDG